MSDLSRFPGGDMVEKGLADIQRGELTEEALLVLMCSPRLTSLGFEIVPPPNTPAICEHALYELLQDRVGSRAHYTYNALSARMRSFANAYALTHRNHVI
ncbi:MAG: hypothetical protein ACAH95_15055 [Fimbriimonas sp.]